MAGIYIHIPFCKQKCHYCNFYSFASGQYRDQFVDALLKELAIRRNYLNDDAIGTIYFGGGTPSMLNSDEIERVVVEIQHLFEVDDRAEITLEANPDDLSPSWVAELKDHTSINRLSIGIQSFFPEDLHYLNRVHDDRQARQSIETALRYNFNNLTIDLIYGIPGLTNEKWLKNLEIFFSYDLPHLSSYSLTVEPKTALSTLIRKGKMEGVSDEQSVGHFKLLLEETAKQGFIHYEISNFAKEGHYSRHNSIYWLGGHYLGLGPSAHSFNGKTRQWNISNMRQYVQAQSVAQIVEEKEVLTPEQQFNEYIMTSLRTCWGCDREHIMNVFGAGKVQYLEEGIAGFVKEGKVTRDGNKYFLTDYGKLFADGIASALFF